MKKILNYLIAATFVSFFAFVFSAASFRKQSNNTILDGKTYEMVITKEGDKKAIPLKDNLVFKDGIFNTSYFMQLQKFPSGVYSTIGNGSGSTGIITFKSQSTNKVKDNISWVGKINGDHVEGTAKIFIKKTKDIVEYTFTGNLRKKNVPMKVVNDTIQTPSDSTKVQK